MHNYVYTITSSQMVMDLYVTMKCLCEQCVWPLPPNGVCYSHTMMHFYVSCLNDSSHQRRNNYIMSVLMHMWRRTKHHCITVQYTKPQYTHPTACQGTHGLLTHIQTAGMSCMYSTVATSSPLVATVQCFNNTFTTLTPIPLCTHISRGQPLPSPVIYMLTQPTSNDIIKLLPCTCHVRDSRNQPSGNSMDTCLTSLGKSTLAPWQSRNFTTSRCPL